MKNINEKIKELNLEKQSDFISWLYEGDTYKDGKGNTYCVINNVENEDLGVIEGTHLYLVKSGDIEDEFAFSLIV